MKKTILIAIVITLLLIGDTALAQMGSITPPSLFKILNDSIMPVKTDWNFVVGTSTGTTGSKLTVFGTSSLQNIIPQSDILYTLGTSALRWNAWLGTVDIATATISGVVAGNMDMANNLITNIGNAGTDFITGGGLTLAGNLTANGSSTFGANFFIDGSGNASTTGNLIVANLTVTTNATSVTLTTTGQATLASSTIGTNFIIDSSGNASTTGSLTVTATSTLATTTISNLTVTTINNSSTTDWDTAYTERREWNGGDTNLVAATGRTSLGLGDASLLASTTWAQIANNLSDLANTSTARTNLGLAIGSDVQAYDSNNATTGVVVASLNGNTGVQTLWGTTNLLTVSASGTVGQILNVGTDVATTGVSALLSLTSVGTIATGTWNADIIGNTKGGTAADTSGWTGLVKTSVGTWSTTTDNSVNWDAAYGWGDYSTSILKATTTSFGDVILVAGACTSTTTTVANATNTMAVSVTPRTYPGDGTYWAGYVSNTDEITVKVCAIVGITPNASEYDIRVIK